MKIVFLTDAYHLSENANGACARQIAIEMKNRGHDIHVICWRIPGEGASQQIDGISVHRIYSGFIYTGFARIRHIKNAKLAKIYFFLCLILRGISAIVHLPVFPVSSFLRANRYYRAIRKLHKKEKIDIIIANNAPIESVLGMVKAKKKYGIKSVMYTLDPLTNRPPPSRLSHKFAENQGHKWEKKIYRVIDLVLNLKSYSKHFEQKSYREYREKMRLIDIPLYVPGSIMVKSDYFDAGFVHMVYAGALTALRNPEYLCQMLQPQKKCILHFYTRGGYEKLLESYNKKTNGAIICHGYVGHDELQKIYHGADILVSIGNRESEFLPSKIFAYMATGKKIIHLYTGDADSSLPYLRQYPHALLIDERGDYAENIRRVGEFIVLPPSGDIDMEHLKDVFIMNTPEYTADLIFDFFQKEMKDGGM